MWASACGTMPVKTPADGEVLALAKDHDAMETTMGHEVARRTFIKAGTTTAALAGMHLDACAKPGF